MNTQKDYKGEAQKQLQKERNEQIVQQIKYLYRDIDRIRDEIKDKHDDIKKLEEQVDLLDEGKLEDALAKGREFAKGRESKNTTNTIRYDG